MKPTNMADSIAAEMDRILNSEENKQIFSPKIEKLAFSRVADADKSTDLAKEMEVAMDKTAQLTAAPAPTPPGQTPPAQQPATQQPNRETCKACKGFYVRDDGGTKCTCEEQGLKFQDCKMNPECHCHKHPATPAVNPVAWHADDGKTEAAPTVASMVASLNKISETLDNAGLEKLAAVSLMLADRIVVEAKAKSKSKKSDKKDSKKSKKMTTKERMDKMRAAKGKGKKSEPKSKKSK
jgi:hypothetical protein